MFVLRLEKLLYILVSFFLFWEIVLMVGTVISSGFFIVFQHIDNLELNSKSIFNWAHEWQTAI